ncbi:DsbA family oxidoreductase [Pseudomonas sp. GD03944]|uniref:DsbA family oxidoreductase n=1 Tax=Pseudomonas sp. GD03944 TaxID=2975409 RepID=UPI0024497C3D|nr:DsbA family oxidoreductase [Pseudomonas sp. GD03944]MDH1263239.1 DsbA family oxidoreductase [Pseudomonas sp. GD03944]
MEPIAIRIAFDFLCPWCWIGQVRLGRAIHDLGLDDHCMLSFTPCRTGLRVPAAGLDWQTYRISRFGSWLHSQAHYAEVIQAGQALGLVFDFARIRTAPNTLAAHRLMGWVQGQGQSAAALSLALFQAHFSDGRDIGNPQVLARIAAEHGQSTDDVLAFLASDEGVAEVLAQEQAELASGQGAIPRFQLPGTTISGAQSQQIFSLALACHVSPTERNGP